jgi:hypothetical protein
VFSQGCALLHKLPAVSTTASPVQRGKARVARRGRVSLFFDILQQADPLAYICKRHHIWAKRTSTRLSRCGIFLTAAVASGATLRLHTGHLTLLCLDARAERLPPSALRLWGLWVLEYLVVPMGSPSIADLQGVTRPQSAPIASQHLHFGAYRSQSGMYRII